MCGPKKPKKPKATASEIKQAEIGARDVQRFENTFLPLELDAIKEASVGVRDKEARILKGRTTADLAQDSAIARGSNRINLRNGGDAFASESSRTSNAVAEAGSQASQGAERIADDRFAKKGLDVAKTGRDLARSVNSGLSTAADSEVMRQRSKLKADAIRSAAKMKAITDLASAGASIYALRGGGQPFTKNPEVVKGSQMFQEQESRLGTSLNAGMMVA